MKPVESRYRKTVLATAFFLLEFCSRSFSLPQSQASAPAVEAGGVCKSKNCQNYSDLLASFVNTTVNPCDDFYDNVCGQWADPSFQFGKKHWSVFGYIHGKTELETFKFHYQKFSKLEKPHWHDLDFKTLAKVQNFHRRCEELSDTYKTDDSRHGLIYSLIENILAKTTDSKTRVFEMLMLADEVATPILSELTTVYDYEDKKTNHLKLSKWALKSSKVPKEDENKFIQNSQVNFSNSLESIYGLEAAANNHGQKPSNWTKIGAEVARLYFDYAQLSEKRFPGYVDGSFNFLPLAYAAQKLPFFELERYFQVFFARLGVDVAKTIDIKIVAVEEIEYFKELSQLLLKYDIKIVEYYLVVRLYEEVSDFISGVHDPQNNFFGGAQTAATLKAAVRRYSPCYLQTEHNFGMAFDRFFGMDNYNKSVELNLQAVFKDLKQEFLKFVDNSSIFNDFDRPFIRNKVVNIRLNAGYTESRRDAAFVASRFEGVSESDSNYFELLRSVRGRAMAHETARLDEIYTLDQNYESSWSVIASYQTEYNLIKMPASLLQLPLYATDLPDSVVFGNAGFILAHEIAHAIGLEGRAYDDHADKSDWLLDSTKRGFKEIETCLIDQYRNLKRTASDDPSYEYVLDSVETLDENFADSLAFRIAFGALKARMERQGNMSPDHTIVGFEDKSWAQMFFYSQGSFWCSQESKWKLRMMSIFDTMHSLPRYRVNIAPRNTPYFEETFQCAAKRSGAVAQTHTQIPEKRCPIV